MSSRFTPGPARPDTPARRLERATKRILSRGLAALVRPAPLAPHDLLRADVRRLVVIRQHNQLGDMVCALPALHALRRTWPAAHLVFVASPLSAPLMSGHPDVDELLVFRKQEAWRPWTLAAFLRRLRFPRADLTVVLSTVSFSTTSALLAWATGARMRVGGSSLPFGSHLSRAVFHLELPEGPSGVHETQHHLQPLRELGLATPQTRPVLTVRPGAQEAAGSRLHDLAPGPGPLVLAHVGAGKLPNIWPADRFAAVLAALRAQDGARVVLIAGPSDTPAVQDVVERLPQTPVWRAPLPETFGALAAADLVVSNDTGMAHVAAALGVPLVVIFGPTDATRWSPPGEHVRVVRSPTGSIADVDVADVLQAARTALRMRRAPASGAQTLHDPA